MTAGDLARLLALLPEDMPVLVGGLHIDRIYKSADDTTLITGDAPDIVCETGRCVIRHNYIEVPDPAHIDIYGGTFGRGVKNELPAPVVSLKSHGRARWPKGAAT